MKNPVLLALLCLPLAACQPPQADAPQNVVAKPEPPAAPVEPPPPNMAKINEHCSAYSSLAARVMEGRQAGITMSESMKIMADDGTMQQLVISAYEQPRYATERMQKRAIVDFENTVHLACVQDRTRR